MRPAIILFAKAPVPGAVKTRLLARFSPVEAASFHDACVRDLLTKLGGLAGAADVELHTDTSTDAWTGVEVAKRLQTRGDLGARMLHAIDHGLRENRPSVLIVGGDVPTVPLDHLCRLICSQADVALGPTEDGGYYAIQCRRTRAPMFDGVEWSTGSALDQTIRAARRCGLTVEIGPRWHDVDTPEDLMKLAAEDELPEHVDRWLRDCGLRQPGKTHDAPKQV